MKKWTPQSITKVEVLLNFQLVCTFENSQKYLFDMNYITKEDGEMIKPLKNKTYFKRVFLEAGHPTWPNGYDVCADYIFQNSIKIEDKTVKKLKKLAA
jgi:hypothetical protein